MKVLVIGSDSYIGKCFIQRYKGTFDIIPLSRVKTGLQGEIIFPDLSRIPAELFSHADSVINFAAIVHRPEITDLASYKKVNCDLAVLNALKAKKNGAKQFIQLSTIAVYGSVEHINSFSECNPVSNYGISKYLADKELLNLGNKNFKITVLRPPMVYGGANTPGNLLRLIKLVETGIPLPLKGISNKRDFINVNNLIQYLAFAIEQIVDGVYIVTDKEPVSTEYLLQLIYKSMHKKENLFRLPSMFIYFLKTGWPDTYSKLIGSLEVNPNFPVKELAFNYSVESGIKESVESYLATKNIR